MDFVATKSAIKDRLALLLAGDVGGLANPGPPFLRLGVVISNFDEGLTLQLADLTVIASADIVGNMDFDVTGPTYYQRWQNDGWLICNTGLQFGFWYQVNVPTLPVTVYGLALIGDGGTVLFASERFTNPIFWDSYQFIDFPGETTFVITWAALK